MSVRNEKLIFFSQKEGYHDDWQLVIELTFEIDEKINQISSIAGNTRILNKFIDGNL